MYDGGDKLLKVQFYRSIAIDAVVVSFRGTSSLSNWYTDFDFFPTNCVLNNKNCGRIQNGFYQAYLSLRPNLMNIVGVKIDMYNSF